MMLSFTLSMPGVASWNGKWSGDGRCYVLVRGFRKPPVDPEGEPLAGRYFHYNFGDGWAAGVTVEQIDAHTARKLRRQSDGFAGYDWMVESIIRDGRIVAPSHMRSAP